MIYNLLLRKYREKGEDLDVDELFSDIAFLVKVHREDVNANKNLIGFLVSHVKFYKIFMFLIDNGLDINTIGRANRTALFDAKLPYVKVLIDRGIDINHVDDLGHNVLYYSTRYLKIDIIEILLRNGAHIGKDILVSLLRETYYDDEEHSGEYEYDEEGDIEHRNEYDDNDKEEALRFNLKQRKREVTELILRYCR